jgi:RNA polymerase sigma-70 factor (ECF subfamily)
MTGDGAAFETWYQAEAGRMAAGLRVALGDADLAEEVTSEAFARAWARWDRVAAMASPSGWVYQVAMNLARSRFRRARLERRVAARRRVELPVPAPEPPSDELRTALASLADRARTAVALRYVADLPEAEVARLMGVTRGTVASTLSAARRQLAARLRPDVEHHDEHHDEKEQVTP